MHKRKLSIDDFNNLNSTDPVYFEDSLEGFREMDKDTLGALFRYGLLDPKSITLYVDVDMNWDGGGPITYEELLEENENSLFVYLDKDIGYEPALQWKIVDGIDKGQINPRDLYRLDFKGDN